MSVIKGARMFANRGKAQPTTAQLAAAKDYQALAKSGPSGRGALRYLAGSGDREARDLLRSLERPDPNEVTTT